MGRRAKPIIESSGKVYSKKEVAFTLGFIGRVGKLLEQRGVDPSTVFFIPGCFHLAATMNPHTNLSQREFLDIFKEASKWVYEKLNNIINVARPGTCVWKQIRPLCVFYSHPGLSGSNLILYNLLLERYFETVKAVKWEEWEDYKNAILSPTLVPNEFNGKPQVLTLEAMLTSLSSVTHLAQKLEVSRYELCETQSEDIVGFTVSRPICSSVRTPPEFKTDNVLKWYSFKLSQYGREAFTNFIESSSKKFSRFKISTKAQTVSLEVLPDLDLEITHTDVRLVQRKMEEIFLELVSNAVEKATEGLKNALSEQIIQLNDLVLPDKVKQRLISKIQIFPSIGGLRYMGRVLRILRDKKRDITSVIADLITDESEKQREAGITLLALLDEQLKEDEDSNQEEE